MRSLLWGLLLSTTFTAAAATQRPVIKEFGPATIPVGSGERYLGITGSHFSSGSEGPVVVYSGPAGTFTIAPSSLWGFEPQVRIQVWVPGEIVYTIGRYSVIVRNEATGDSDPVYFDVTGEAQIVLRVPSYVNVEATSPSGAVATFEVSAESTTGAPVDLSCSHASGSTFPLGMTNVRCTGTLADGSTRSANFVVSVIDRTPPVLTLPADILREATENGGAIVHFETSATDIADTHVPVQCSPASGSLFGIGTTEVRCSARDDSFNSTTRSFHVTVTESPEEDPPPVLTLPADVSVEAATPDGTAVTFTATAHDETDGDLAVSCDPASGATFPLGATAVTCSATNARSISVTGTFQVSVVDTIAPEIVAISVSPDLLWPVNKRLIDVVVSVTATDDGDAMPTARIAGVIVSEHVQASDWHIVDDLTIALRADRNGKEKPRVYTIVVEVSDASGNVSTATVDVTVPHDDGTDNVTKPPVRRRRAVRH